MGYRGGNGSFRDSKIPDGNNGPLVQSVPVAHTCHSQIRILPDADVSVLNRQRLIKGLIEGSVILAVYHQRLSLGSRRFQPEIPGAGQIGQFHGIGELESSVIGTSQIPSLFSHKFPPAEHMAGPAAVQGIHQLHIRHITRGNRSKVIKPILSGSVIAGITDGV